MRGTLLILLATLGLVLAAPAAASEIIDRDVELLSFKVNAAGQAGLVYRTPSKGLRYVLAWGAVNAIDPARGVAQIAFRKDYAGGWGTYRRNVVKGMIDTCRPYDGPPLPWFLAGCKALDGSYWALQYWQRGLPNLGLDPWKPLQAAQELHLSHWTGDLPLLTVYADWVYRPKYHHLFGTFTYLGKPVFGFESTRTGVPLDDFGRNMYLDTFDSAYGPGWKRENSFLTHVGTGAFCYGFYPHDPYTGYPGGRRPQGHGTRYRITAKGPGATPLVSWEGPDPGDYDPNDPAKRDLETRMNELQLSLHDERCVKK